jgi:hypothetical protein
MFIIVMGVFIAVRESMRLSDAGVIDPSGVQLPVVEPMQGEDDATPNSE